MKQYTKKLLMLLCLMALFFSGCSSNQSTITFVPLTEQEKNIACTTGDAFGIWNFSFQDEIQGMALSFDVWQYGVCTDSDLFYQGDTKSTKALYLSMQAEYKEQCIESQWQWLRDTGVGTAKASPTLMSIPLTDAYTGWTCGFWNHEEPVILEPGENYILAVQNFDLHGDGLNGVICGNLKERGSSFDTEAYVIALRLQTFATAEEAEAVK